ncbi:MAG TPA: AmmeMemoRadiSam system protein A [Thermoanaerobaculia bacterium]|nr:AmmeMemoRadiSam system protein A [Thermoanaerobaculia bacterium]
MLSPEQRTTLLGIARQTIRSALEGSDPRRSTPPADPALLRPAGCFVTLHTREGELRGCIGSIRPVAPLVEAVVSSALNAAFRDPRFPAVRTDELDDLRIEISVMGPIEQVTDLESIVVGRDGLIISKGHYAGLLLPQVATEYGWDRETFLSQTCMKAGLPPSAWRNRDTRIEKFSAEVFSE